MEEHIQDVASHQHPDDVDVNEGGRNLSIVQELFEDKQERKAEPRVKLLIAKEDTPPGLPSQWTSDLHPLGEQRCHSKCRSAHGTPAHLAAR